MTPETKDPPMTPDMTDTDDVLVALAPKLGAASFEKFFDEHNRDVVALVFSLSGNRSTAEDVTQEAFTEAFRRWHTVGGYDNPGAWVRRVAINKSVSGVRRRVNESKALKRLAGRRQPEQADPHSDAGDFWAAVRRLPTRQAQAVALHYLEDRSIAQIAQVLDLAEPTVRVHLHRGRLALAQQLGLDQKEEER